MTAPFYQHPQSPTNKKFMPKNYHSVMNLTENTFDNIAMQSKAPRKERGFTDKHISQVMQTSSGRDKVCGLLQYVIQLYEISLRNHETVLFGEHFNRSKVCHRIVKSLSNSRKMLRFMKFINAIRRFIRYSREVFHLKLKKINIIEFVNLYEQNGNNGNNKPNSQGDQELPYQTLRINFQGILKLLRLLIRLIGHISAIFFYIFDDIVLFAQLKLISPHLIEGQIQWVHLRNYFGLWKNLLHMANSLMLMFSLNQQERFLDKVLARVHF